MRRLIPLLVMTATVGLACTSSGTTSAKTPAGNNQPAAGAGATGEATTTTIKTPSYKGSSSSHYCDLSRQVQSSSKLDPTGDLKATFANFDSLVNEFLSVAPSAIQADAHTLVNALRQFEQALKAANWDYTKLSPTALQALQDPSFSAAAQRITAYDLQVCGIGTTPST